MNEVYNTLFEMMDDRGFSCTTDKTITNNIKIIDFDITFNKKEETIHIFYIPNVKIGINNIKYVIETLEKKNNTHGLIIFSMSVTSFAKQFVENCEYKLELFSENDLYKNITKHYLVPKHELLNQDKIEILLKELKIKQMNLPKIKKNDPISKYYGADVNNVFQITRFNDNIESLYYRNVI